ASCPTGPCPSQTITLTIGTHCVITSNRPWGYPAGVGLGQGDTPVQSGSYYNYPLQSNNCLAFTSTVNAASWAGGTATLTLNGTNYYNTSSTVTVAGFTPSAWNCSGCTITSYSKGANNTGTISYAIASDPGTATTLGTATPPPLTWSATGLPSGMSVQTIAGGYQRDQIEADAGN